MGPGDVTPSVRPFVAALTPTTGHSAPPPRIGTLALAGAARSSVSLHTGAAGSHVPNERLCRSSRRLHAGCRLGSNQGAPQTRPGPTTTSRFRHRLYAFDTSSAVRSRSPLRHSPDGMMSRLFLRRSPRGLLTDAARSGLGPVPDDRPRGAVPHRSISTTPPFVGMFVAHCRRQGGDRGRSRRSHRLHQRRSACHVEQPRHARRSGRPGALDAATAGQLPFFINYGGDGPASAKLVCGFLACDAQPFNPLLENLPPVIKAGRPARAAMPAGSASSSVWR